MSKIFGISFKIHLFLYYVFIGFICYRGRIFWVNMNTFVFMFNPVKYKNHFSLLDIKSNPLIQEASAFIDNCQLVMTRITTSIQFFFVKQTLPRIIYNVSKIQQNYYIYIHPITVVKKNINNKIQDVITDQILHGQINFLHFFRASMFCTIIISMKY